MNKIRPKYQHSGVYILVGDSNHGGELCINGDKCSGGNFAGRKQGMWFLSNIVREGLSKRWHLTTARVLYRAPGLAL